MAEKTRFYIHIFEKNGLFTGEDIQTSYDDAMEYLEGYGPCFTDHGHRYVHSIIPQSDGKGGYRYIERDLMDDMEAWLAKRHNDTMEVYQMRDWYHSKVL